MRNEESCSLIDTGRRATACCCSGSWAQQPKEVPRIGYLSSTDAAREFTRAEVIRLALRERGYIERQNIAIEYRYTEGKVDRAPELAAELVRLKVDIIVVAGGDSWTPAAKDATKTIPIVMVGSGSDPIAAGYTRVDVRMDHTTGKLYVLEVNAQCGLSEDEDYTSIGAILRLSGCTFTALVAEIIYDALRRRSADEK
jgi:hypothetical protein